MRERRRRLGPGRSTGTDLVGGNGAATPGFPPFPPLPGSLRPAKRGYAALNRAKSRFPAACKIFQGKDPPSTKRRAQLWVKFSLWAQMMLAGTHID
jgi:hypothetical protein